MMDDDDCGAMGGMKIGRGNRSTRRKPAPVPLCPPQIPHDQAWTRVSAVGSQLLTAWAMERPSLSVTFSNHRFSNCSPNSDVGFVKFTFLKTGSSRRIISSAVNCAAIVAWIFGNNPSQCTYDLFLPMLIFAHCYSSLMLLFRWFVYADITLKTAALDTPNNVMVFVIDAPAKRAPTVCPLLFFQSINLLLNYIIRLCPLNPRFYGAQTNTSQLKTTAYSCLHTTKIFH
jgi:hypothetical protein